MIRILLAFFGYVKVPTEAVRLSMLLEHFFKRISEYQPEDERKKLLYEASHSLTEFLRSGKLLDKTVGTPTKKYDNSILSALRGAWRVVKPSGKAD